MPHFCRSRLVAVAGWCLFVASIASPKPSQAAEPNPSKRLVMVELYTSQGCDMCPTAEKILGDLGQLPGVVPIAFHVDYFDAAWKDRFSDPMYSQRQMTYNQIYTKPKPADYGLYYTPMMMVNGTQSVNGRDAPTARKAIQLAAAQPSEIRLTADLKREPSGRTGTVAVRVTPRSGKLAGRSLLVCGVLREDGVSTNVLAGENKGKTLVARYPARQTKFEITKVEGSSPVSRQLTFTADPSWNATKLRLAVFVQDQKSGEVYQVTDQPWEPETKPLATTTLISK